MNFILQQISKNSPKMLMGNTENIVKKMKNNKSKKFATKNTKKTRMSESSDSSNDHNISVYKVILLLFLFYVFLIYIFYFFYQDEIGKITSNSINISNKQNSKPINIENSVNNDIFIKKTYFLKSLNYFNKIELFLKHESCTNVTKTKTAVKKSKVRKNVESNTSFLGTSKQM